MGRDVDGIARKRSRWWPLTVRSVQITILVVIVIYLVNLLVALLFPGTQV